MSPTPPIALILVAGSNVGHHVGRAFAAKGYKIVATARSVKEADGSSDQIHVQSNLSNPAGVAELFATVKTQLGHPSVVIYNAAAVTLNDPKNPFSVCLSDFQRDFAELPESAARTFNYTGNCLNVSPILPLTDAGVGKSATAHLIHCASEALKDRGFKFYYADERNGMLMGLPHILRNEYIIELEERVKEMEGQLQIAYKLNVQAGRPPLQPTSPRNILPDLLSGHHQIQHPNMSSWNEPSLNLMDLVVPKRNIAPYFPRYLDLPSKSSALILIEEGFRSFNRYFPIFDEQKFMTSFDARYSAAGLQDLAWWACVNVALSMGHAFRAIRTSRSKHDMALSYGYIQNVLGVVSQLIALPGSLAVIQALLGTILILEGTPNSQMCPVLMATAMGMTQAMGLHRRDRDPPGLSLSEIEERRNVFWIAYWIEKNISCLRRQASVQDDDDIDVELPTGIVSEPHLLSHGPATINILNSRIGLAIIQGQIYKRLFSVQAQRQSKAQRAAAALDLSGLLACWRASVPFDFEESSMTSLRLPLPEDVLQIIILHTVYANSVITVDRHLPQRGNPAAGPADIYTYTLPSESVCLIDSRKAIQLLQKIPRGKYAFVW
ncbi:fungal specific transcription factor domain-containing protein [Seiridium cupressi]